MPPHHHDLQSRCCNDTLSPPWRPQASKIALGLGKSVRHLCHRGWVRLATWNVNSVGPRLPRLLAWLDDVKPDVLCLQETKCRADAFPAAEVAGLGYETAAHGDGRWNGVALLSRVGLVDVTRGFPGQPGFAAETS